MATIPRMFSVPSYAEDFWEWLVKQRNFQTLIRKQGYYILEKAVVAISFREWVEERNRLYIRNGVSKREYKIPSFTFDFRTQIPRVLDTNELYTVPLGSGNCAVFDSRIFPSSNLPRRSLNSDTQLLALRKRSGSSNLIHAISAHWNEQTFLRALHYCGAFSAIVKKICNTARYNLGPSGHIPASFPFWMKNKRGGEKRFVFEGVIDTDECLFPNGTNVVIPIEAKLDNGHEGLSWHKLAFSAYRFIDNSRALRTFRTGSSINGISKKVRIVPVYCVCSMSLKKAYIHIFPSMAIKRYGSRNPEFGLVLNDQKQLKPRNSIEIKLDWL